jgi:hypothetical protein
MSNREQNFSGINFFIAAALEAKNLLFNSLSGSLHRKQRVYVALIIWHSNHRMYALISRTAKQKISSHFTGDLTWPLNGLQ